MHNYIVVSWGLLEDFSEVTHTRHILKFSAVFWMTNIIVLAENIEISPFLFKSLS